MATMVANVAMAWEYWNTVNLLTSTVLLLWLMRSFRNLYRAFKVRAALITGRVVQVRGLSSYLHYLEGVTPPHATHIMHTRQVEPPKGVQSMYNPVTVGSVSVSMVDADRSVNRKLRYHVELSTSVPCKVMALTDFFPSAFKRKVDDPGFGTGSNTATSGRSRSNSRSNLNRSRSNSRSSAFADGWLETLQSEDMAAGGVGMGVHGLFERSKICHSSSKLTEVGPGVHSLELETLMLNLDRYIAPNLPAAVPPRAPSSTSETNTMPMSTPLSPGGAGGNGGEVDMTTIEEGQVPTPPAESEPAPEVKKPPSEVLFGLLIVPEGPIDVDLHIAEAEISHKLSQQAEDGALSGLGATTATTTASTTGSGTTAGGGQDKAGVLTTTAPASANTTNSNVEATNGDNAGVGGGGRRRQVRDRPFLNLLRGLVGVHVPPEDTGGAFPYFSEDPQNIPPGANTNPAAVASEEGSGSAGLTIVASDGLTGVELGAIRERKKLISNEAVEPAFSMLVMSAAVTRLTETVQNSRNEYSASAVGDGGGKTKDDSRLELASKEYLLGANGLCYTNLEIFGLQSELSTTSFMQMTILNQEQEGGATKHPYGNTGKESDDVGGFEDDCVICMCDEKQVMLLPCRHYCVCPQCLVKIDKCPVCRATFEEYVVITKADKTGSEMTVPIVLGAEGARRRAPRVP